MFVQSTLIASCNLIHTNPFFNNGPFFPYKSKNYSPPDVCLFAAFEMQAAEQPIGDGIWFTCEFTQSKTPPTDGCEMFDDEGFKARRVSSAICV